MKQFLTLDDLPDLDRAINEGIALKKEPYKWEALGKQKTLGMLFFNPSLRTRLSTQKAAQQLGIKTMIMNFSNEAWALEYEDGTQMSGLRSEHIREAAAVISQYCDVVAIRAFASLTDKEKDEQELVLSSFIKYATIPVINMESATAHPLQALADAITLKEHQQNKRPKIVLTWAPHPKALPHAVGNSFARMIQKIEADFVYAKNWCSYSDYGKILKTDDEWMVTAEKMKLTNKAKFMHCLPIRRNIVAEDAVLDSPNSLVIEQANNRTFAAQVVLKKILEHG